MVVWAEAESPSTNLKIYRRRRRCSHAVEIFSLLQTSEAEECAAVRGSRCSIGGNLVSNLGTFFAVTIRELIGKVDLTVPCTIPRTRSNRTLSS